CLCSHWHQAHATAVTAAAVAAPAVSVAPVLAAAAPASLVADPDFVPPAAFPAIVVLTAGPAAIACPSVTVAVVAMAARPLALSFEVSDESYEPPAPRPHWPSCNGHHCRMWLPAKRIGVAVERLRPKMR